MNKYKLQYWIYACLNKKFGQEVILHRDSLHSIYQVNRHGFEISTNTAPIALVREWLFAKLKDSSFSFFQEGSFKFFKKIIGDKEFIIHIHEQSRGLDWKNSNRPVILIQIQSYEARS